MPGEPFASPQRDELIRSVQLRLLLSHREELHPAQWIYSLRDPFWRVYVNEDSGASITHQGKTIALRPSALYVLPAWTEFQTRTRQRLFQNYIHFDFTGISPSLLQKIFPHPLRVSATPWLGGLRDEWLRCQREDDPIGLAPFALAGALVHAVMASLFSEISRSDASACFRWMEESGPLGPALRCIEAHPSQPPSNTELARLCGLSLSHFIRRFHLAVGLTPAQYGRERRITLAARLLQNLQTSIDEIAAATGFSDRFHFSRQFTHRLGLSPAKYRQLYRRNSAS